MKILAIEDDPVIGKFIVDGFRQEGHSVDLLNNGRDGLIRAASGEYEVLIIDRMLPGLDGLSLVKVLRSAANKTPIIFLTSLGGIDDRIAGLNAGADDYLVKPFAFGELSARVAALARRQPLNEQQTILTAGDLEMDLLERKVTRAGVTIDLLPREFSLLETLLRRKGQVQTRTMLLETVWDINFDPQTNVVETHISRLRTKVDKPFASELVKTARGAGYWVEA